MTTVEIDRNDVTHLNQKLKDLSQSLDDKTIRKIMRKGAKPFIQAAKSAAPVARKNVHRYSTPKLSDKLKAPKGLGKIAATYSPGNLSRSIKALPLRKLKTSVIIGPKKGGRNSQGLFKGRRVDGFYGHLVEFSTKYKKATPFMSPAWRRTQNQVLAKITKEMEMQISKAAQS